MFWINSHSQLNPVSPQYVISELTWVKFHLRVKSHPLYFGKIPEIHLDPSKIPPSNSNISGHWEGKNISFQLNNLIVFGPIWNKIRPIWNKSGPILKKIRPTRN